MLMSYPGPYHPLSDLRCMDSIGGAESDTRILIQGMMDRFIRSSSRELDIVAFWNEIRIRESLCTKDRDVPVEM